MKTCQRFTRIQSGFERDIHFLSKPSVPGSPGARVNAKTAVTVKRNMARALNRHFDRCRECG
ncbi:hypothetical protein [Streptomyces violascens]|uniref:hypothetical protein n=1 Tax=Streptomyces violascens TaxID=67381 RepID=UPI0036A03D9F